MNRLQRILIIVLGLAIWVVMVIAYANTEPRNADKLETGTYETFDWPGW